MDTITCYAYEALGGEADESILKIELKRGVGGKEDITQRALTSNGGGKSEIEQVGVTQVDLSLDLFESFLVALKRDRVFGQNFCVGSLGCVVGKPGDLKEHILYILDRLYENIAFFVVDKKKKGDLAASVKRESIHLS